MYLAPAPCPTIAMLFALITEPLHSLQLSQVVRLPASSDAGHRTSLPLTIESTDLITLKVLIPLDQAVSASSKVSALFIQRSYL